MKQFTNLVAIQDFNMKLEGKGRPCQVKIGDVFTVTNAQHMQEHGIKIMREKLARLNQGYLLPLDQLNQLFKVQE